MIALDEDALICDLAETYGIFNYRSLPLSMVATLSVGLRDNSRIKMRMENSNVDFETMLLAGIYDNLGNLVWMQSKDGQKHINKPASVLNKLIGTIAKPDPVCSFSSGDEFEKTRAEILGKEALSSGE